MVRHGQVPSVPKRPPGRGQSPRRFVVCPRSASGCVPSLATDGVVGCRVCGAAQGPAPFRRPPRPRRLDGPPWLGSQTGWDGLGPGLRIRPQNDLPRPSQSGRHLEGDGETSFFSVSSFFSSRHPIHELHHHHTPIRPVIRPLRLRVHHHCRTPLCWFGVSGCRAEYARCQRDHSRKSKRGRCLPRRGALAQRGGRPHPAARPPPAARSAAGTTQPRRKPSLSLFYL